LRILGRTAGEKTRIVALDGRFDAGTVDEVESFLDGVIADGDVRIVINMSKVSYIGSCGIRLLLALNAKLRERGGTSTLFGIPVSGTRIIQAMQIERFFNICTDEKAALERVLRTS
jgi:anti-anti-sigma factor